MTELTDYTLSRYLEHDPETRRAYHLDPQVHADVERLRQLVDATERALMDERVPAETRKRVINRIVFGDPAGTEAVYVTRREQLRATARLRMPTADAWARLLDPSAGPVRPDEEPTT